MRMGTCACRIPPTEKSEHCLGENPEEIVNNSTGACDDHSDKQCSCEHREEVGDPEWKVRRIACRTRRGRSGRHSLKSTAIPAPVQRQAMSIANAMRIKSHARATCKMMTKPTTSNASTAARVRSLRTSLRWAARQKASVVSSPPHSGHRSSEGWSRPSRL